MLTGCPKSTPKQPGVFKKFNGQETQILDKFDTELAKYNCLMSGRNWSENSVSSTNQQKLAKLEAEEMQISERLQALPDEISKIQQDYLTQENSLLDKQDELEKKLLIAKRREAIVNQIQAYRQAKTDFELQLQRTPQRQTTNRNRLQQQIDMLQQYINELEIQLQNEQTDVESAEVIELELRQLQNRQDRNKTLSDNQLSRKETEQNLLKNRLEQITQEQQNLIVALSQTRFSPPPNTTDSGNQTAYVGCLNGGNGQPTAQQKILARTVRNDLTYQLIRFTDYQYFQFENDLYVKRASGSFLSDVLDFGGNLAGTITNGERAKTIINASLIAFRGGRKSGSINYFQEQTADVLITKMQTSRNRVLKEILTQTNDKDVDDYPLEASLGDAIKYFYAGTLPRALQELKKDVSLAAQVAEDEILELKDIEVTTPATQAKRDVSVRAFRFLNSLAKTIASDSASEGEKTAALGNLQKISELIRKDQKITDVLNEDADLKKLLEDLETISADGILLANTLLDLRSGRDDKPAEATLRAIDTIIINVEKAK